MTPQAVADALGDFDRQAKVMEAFGREAQLFEAPPPQWAVELVRHARGIQAAVEQGRTTDRHLNAAR